MNIDSHQHFWQLSRGDYDWMTEDMVPICRDFDMNDLAPLLAQCQIEGTILVQAAATVAETQFMLAIAETTPLVKGVVGWVDMPATDAGATLEALQENSYFKGIRPMIHDIADVDWMLQSSLTPAIKQLIALDLSFDALVRPVHLPNLLTLLTRYPDLRVVIDHCAKPAIAQGQFEDWARDMKAIADHTQAMCKVSGLLTEAEPGAGLLSLSPYFDHLLACFGSQRLMWGSDWPVINLVSDYEDWYVMSQQYFEQLSAHEQADIMGETARKFYKID